MVEEKNKVCPHCKTEYTDEEMAIKTKTCWFCLAAELKKLDEIDSIPNPADYGRPNGYDELAKRENLAAMKKIAAGQAGTADQRVSADIPESERQELKVEYGVDPGIRIPNTLVTVKGKNDETYIQFSVRGQIPPDLKKEFERILKNMLELFGTLLAFGPSFGGVVAGAKLLTMDNFFQKS
jgi:hypothetical protein